MYKPWPNSLFFPGKRSCLDIIKCKVRLNHKPLASGGGWVLYCRQFFTMDPDIILNTKHIKISSIRIMAPMHHGENTKLMIKQGRLRFTNPTNEVLSPCNATISHPLAEVSFKRIWRREANEIIRLGNPVYSPWSFSKQWNNGISFRGIRKWRDKNEGNGFWGTGNIILIFWEQGNKAMYTPQNNRFVFPFD